MDSKAPETDPSLNYAGPQTENSRKLPAGIAKLAFICGILAFCVAAVLAFGYHTGSITRGRHHRFVENATLPFSSGLVAIVFGIWAWAQAAIHGSTRKTKIRIIIGISLSFTALVAAWFEHTSPWP